MSGEIVPQGAKNEALEVICATLLTPEKVTIHNVPDILDVNNLIQLLRDMRVKVEHPSADTYTFQADDVDMEYLRTEEFLRKSGSLRGSVMIVGPLVARFGRALRDDGVIGYRAHAAGHISDAHRFFDGAGFHQAHLNQLTGQVKAAARFSRRDTFGAGRGLRGEGGCGTEAQRDGAQMTEKWRFHRLPQQVQGRFF